jgi:porphobilinogen synthase
MVRETKLSAEDLIYPLFVILGANQKKSIPSLPGQFHLSADQAALAAESFYRQGGRAVLLFGLPDHKDEFGRSGAEVSGPVPMAIRAIKERVPDILVITDVCLCGYASHGHCGVVEDNRVQNDPTLDLLGQQAMIYAAVGADMVAPSDMMDGRVEVIRKYLDKAGHQRIPIMAYSVKYASSFYGPFREAADSTPSFGDRRGYQMDPANRLEARYEVELDLAEGADIIMVKPAGPYLDIVREIRNLIDRPLAAYQVSGEMAMIKAAAAVGALDLKGAALESLMGIKRAGADLIVTYLAPEVLDWL